MFDQPSHADDTLEQLAVATAGLSIRRTAARTAATRTPASTLRPTKRWLQAASDDDDIKQQNDATNGESSQAFMPADFSTVTPSRLGCIGNLKDELTCGVCLDVLRRPCTTVCGHSFCRSCLRRSLQHSGNCPKCRFQLPAAPLLINTALWNTVQLLFPGVVADAVGFVTPQPENAAASGQLRAQIRPLLFDNGSAVERVAGGMVMRRPFRPPRRLHDTSQAGDALVLRPAPRSVVQPSQGGNGRHLQSLLDEMASVSRSLDAVAPISVPPARDNSLQLQDRNMMQLRAATDVSSAAQPSSTRAYNPFVRASTGVGAEGVPSVRAHVSGLTRPAHAAAPSASTRSSSAPRLHILAYDDDDDDDSEGLWLMRGRVDEPPSSSPLDVRYGRDQQGQEGAAELGIRETLTSVATSAQATPSVILHSPRLSINTGTRQLPLRPYDDWTGEDDPTAPDPYENSPFFDPQMYSRQ